MKYAIVKTMPVAKLYYKGNHTHPVRRTVLVIESNKNYIRGYELREGNEIRSAEKAPIKTYSRAKIAKGMSLRKENPVRKLSPQKSTLVRKNLLDIIAKGI